MWIFFLGNVDTQAVYLPSEGVSNIVSHKDGECIGVYIFSRTEVLRWSENFGIEENSINPNSSFHILCEKSRIYFPNLSR